ncbi:hypothetical protein K3495_g7247 [Podosphaera aphanis]|nr:hypothetical protein K3495_g7247 [Podosphaera aphanis]
MKGPAPRRFRFKLNDKAKDFNAECEADLFYIDGKPVLHVICVITGFGNGRWLTDGRLSEGVLEALLACWGNVNRGLPDVLRVDAGKEFVSKKFRAGSKLLGMTIEEVPVEAHHRIGKVERYHGMVRRAFEIIMAETGGKVSKEAALQWAFKCVNDTAGPDGLVPTLLVFGAYPRLTIDFPPSPSQLQRAHAMQRAMEELRKHRAKRLVNDALNTRNGPDMTDRQTSAIQLGGEVRVWREKKKEWTGPYRVVALGEYDVTVETFNGPLKMAITHITPFFRHSNEDDESYKNDKERLALFEYPEPKQPR